MIESRVTSDDYANRKYVIQTHDREAAEWEARLACNLVERWGIVAGAPDGEDSAGRSRIRCLTPVELVEKACETAALAVAEFRRRGWVAVLPSLDDLDAARDADPKN